MAEKFLDIILRAKNQAGAAFQQFGAQLNGLKSQLGEGSAFGQIGKLALGAGAIAGVTMLLRKATEVTTQIGTWRDELASGAKSTGDVAEEAFRLIPVFGDAWALGRAIRGEFDGTAQATRELAQEMEKVTKENAEQLRLLAATRAAMGAAEKREREDARAAYLATIVDETEREKQAIRDRAAERMKDNNEAYRAKLITAHAMRLGNFAAEQRMNADLAALDRAHAEEVAKEQNDIREKYEAEWVDFIAKSLGEQASELGRRLSSLRAASGVGLPGGAPLSERFGGIGQTYQSAQSVSAQREAAALARQQTQLLREIRDMQRKQPPAILIGV